MITVDWTSLQCIKTITRRASQRHHETIGTSLWRRPKRSFPPRDVERVLLCKSWFCKSHEVICTPFRFHWRKMQKQNLLNQLSLKCMNTCKVYEQSLFVIGCCFLKAHRKLSLLTRGYIPTNSSTQDSLQKALWIDNQDSKHNTYEALHSFTHILSLSLSCLGL